MTLRQEPVLGGGKEDTLPHPAASLHFPLGHLWLPQRVTEELDSLPACFFQHAKVQGGDISCLCLRYTQNQDSQSHKSQVAAPDQGGGPVWAAVPYLEDALCVSRDSRVQRGAPHVVLDIGVCTGLQQALGSIRT